MKFRPTPPLLLLRRLARSIEANGVRGAAAHSCKRLVRSLRNHGFRGTFERAFRKAPVAPERAGSRLPHPFDLLHGTDTGGYISGADLSAVSFSAFFATGYLGISPSTLRPALASLLIRHEEFTFVDLGCGKGRALFVASEFPFTHVVGVEIAGELCETAQSNAQKRPDWAKRISVHNQDARTFVYPAGPLCLFLYNPFSASIMKRVIENLERQLRESPRPLLVLYAEPTFGDLMASSPLLRQTADVSYSMSPDDAALNPFGRSEERFRIYTTDFAQ